MQFILDLTKAWEGSLGEVLSYANVWRKTRGIPPSNQIVFARRDQADALAQRSDVPLTRFVEDIDAENCKVMANLLTPEEVLVYIRSLERSDGRAIVVSYAGEVIGKINAADEEQALPVQAYAFTYGALRSQVHNRIADEEAIRREQIAAGTDRAFDTGRPTSRESRQVLPRETGRPARHDDQRFRSDGVGESTSSSTVHQTEATPAASKGESVESASPMGPSASSDPHYEDAQSPEELSVPSDPDERIRQGIDQIKAFLQKEEYGPYTHARALLSDAVTQVLQDLPREDDGIPLPKFYTRVTDAWLELANERGKPIGVPRRALRLFLINMFVDGRLCVDDNGNRIDVPVDEYAHPRVHVSKVSEHIDAICNALILQKIAGGPVPVTREIMDELATLIFPRAIGENDPNPWDQLDDLLHELEEAGHIEWSSEDRCFRLSTSHVDAPETLAGFSQNGPASEAIPTN